MKGAHASRLIKFCRLVHQANDIPSEQLLKVLKDPTQNLGRFNALFRLACLRILVCREYGLPGVSGLPYPQRKRAVRGALGI